MRSAQLRRGFTLVQLLVILAILLILLGLLFPAVAKVREASARMNSANNLKQILLALHNYHDANNQFPAGVDDNSFSASARLLPYVEQDNVYRMIDFKKSVDDKANATMRAVHIKVFVSPLDPQGPPSEEYGPTNYLYNDLVFARNANTKIRDITDGLSNTVALGETLKGDGQTKAESVKRQYVLLGKDDLKGINPNAGVKPFEDGKHIAGDRCASWMDGRFLQGTFNGALKLEDDRPDVSCAGLGGVSSLRSLEHTVLVGMCDGSTRSVSTSLTHTTWKAALTPRGGEVLGADW